MTHSQTQRSIATAIAWCLAWGDRRAPACDLATLHQIRQALTTDTELPNDTQLRSLIEQVHQLEALKFPDTLDALKQLATQHPALWDNQIGLVYGGATKIKQYVFEAAKLPEIRGASALLDRINLVDLPAFFGCENHDDYPQCQQAKEDCQQIREDWLDSNFPNLSTALIPELIIYSTGGNILAFCPAAFVDDLANAIEKRYTQETLTANSCAVGAKFRPLEIRFGLLQDPIENTFWLEKYRSHLANPFIQAYFQQPSVSNEEAFENRKSFNELVGQLTSQFNKRRNGHDRDDRPTRQYPPMFETHPYLIRDEGDRRSAVIQTDLPNSPWFSETLARKRLVGQIAKREKASQNWYDKTGLEWQPGTLQSWVQRFEEFLNDNPQLSQKYYQNNDDVTEALSVREIGNASTPSGFVAYIYADGNNMGGYIQRIKTPEEYKQFSKDIFDATERSVYRAIAKHLHPHKLENLTDPDHRNRNDCVIHPFEILAIGGDDVMLIVPANQALAIAKTIGEEFEHHLIKTKRYPLEKPCSDQAAHRYSPQHAPTSQCSLSMSIGVLLTAENTPIYYAEELTSQLLKSAKKRVKDLKKEHNYHSGTIDFLTMKSVTMISSSISEFRTQGLTKTRHKQPTLKLYASPYTLYEIGGLLNTVQALKRVDFPRSQLYQIRSLLEQGKHTAILNYRYFRVRLKQGQTELKRSFEDAWCKPKNTNNNGNLAPWMTIKKADSDAVDQEKTIYETIWRELVDLYPFITEAEALADESTVISEPEMQSK
ncbi:type III-B CRISPR-associated protein Cas10/Cmr2 [Phormidesmis priestleyi]